jgi:hypothetical protein
MIAALETKEVETDLTPMIDVAFLMIIFFMCLPFKALDARLASFLPTEKGIRDDYVRPVETFPIKVHIVGRDEQDRAWGPADQRSIVQTPTRVAYRFEDGRTVNTLAEVGAEIRRAQQAAAGLERVQVRGEVTARPRVPHKFAIAVLNKFAEARVKDVDFYGTKLPDRRLMHAPVLPYPADR